MITAVMNRAVVSDLVAAVKETVLSGVLDEHVADAARAVGADAATAEDARRMIVERLPENNLGPESEPAGEEPFMSPDPMVSLLQSSFEARLHQQGVVQPTPGGDANHGLFSHTLLSAERILQDDGRFSEGGWLSARDPGLVAEVAKGMLKKLAEGNHAFNPGPAEAKFANDARVIVVGDWGSGHPHARTVAGLMAAEVADAMAEHREVHVIHLGDVYYAGEHEEYRNHVLADGWWPVTLEQATSGAGSWSLMGNADMFGGGHGYFKVLLGDPRFHLQRCADGNPTSWFRVSSEFWEVIGLDTAWDPDVLAQGDVGVLQDPQTDVVTGWIDAAPEKKRLLLSHHQFMTVYDQRGIGPVLLDKLSPLVEEGAITAWIWGHEHRCMGFVHPNVPYPRCLGHGGVQLAPKAPGTRPPKPGVWEETVAFAADDGSGSWGRFGFAVLDFDGANVQVRYRNDEGAPSVRSEQL
jgi:hypothetical protein